MGILEYNLNLNVANNPFQIKIQTYISTYLERYLQYLNTNLNFTFAKRTNHGHVENMGGLNKLKVCKQLFWDIRNNYENE